MDNEKKHELGFVMSEDYKRAFNTHTKNAARAMMGFCMNALTSYKENPENVLNESVMRQIVEFESMAVLQQIQSPEFLEYVRTESIRQFIDIQEALVEPMEIAKALSLFDESDDWEDA
jgi:hypothetical protein